MSNLLPENIVNMQFLVTDDYESMRIMIADHLKQLGIKRIQFAKSGNEAFNLIVKNLGTPAEIQFLVSDLMMDDGNGIDLVKAVRANPAVKKVPILIVTSKAEVNYVIECVKAGVSNYIVKPWQLEDLSKKIVDSVSKAKP